MLLRPVNCGYLFLYDSDYYLIHLFTRPLPIIPIIYLLLHSKNFNLIGCRKMEAVGAALKLGYNVIFSDVDIAMLRDPIDDLFLPGTMICCNSII